MSEGEASHSFLVAPGDFILGIVVKEKVGGSWISTAYRIKPQFGLFVTKRTVSMGGIVYLFMTIVRFIIHSTRIPNKRKIVISLPHPSIRHLIFLLIFLSKP